MNYNDAIDLLYNSLPVFQNIGPGAYKPGLDTSRFLDDLVGNPHRKYLKIHIAGTNGKGSTAHSLAAILAKSGYTVGLYTSPHIYDFRERIRVNGQKISEEAVTDFVERWINIRDRYPQLSPSFFELTSTMAFEYFAKEQVDIAVIETGLGGRLDSTNIITPILSVITNISLDHTSLLGDTYKAIAKEKAGIIKPGVPVVIGEWRDDTADVFRSTAEANNAEIIFASEVSGQIEAEHNVYPATEFGGIIGELRGECQLRNASTVFAAIGVLRQMMNIPDEAVRDGMADVTGLTGLFGRWSKIAEAPLTICDTGHNQGGWELLVNEIVSVKNPRKQLVIGFVADKDLGHILELISTVKDEVTVWFSGPSCQRGLPAPALADKASSMGIEGTVVPDVNDAVRLAREAAGKDGFVLVAGSNFLMADLGKIAKNG